MKFSRKVTEEVEVCFVQIVVPVRYGEEDMPNEAPLRSGDQWSAIVDVETGQIINWPQAYVDSLNRGGLSFYMKVVDQGCYTLLDALQNPIAERSDDYVPHCTIPGKYGDYISLDINSSGLITNWQPDGTFSGFSEEDED